MALLYGASAIYMVWVSIIRDSLFGQWLLIMLFNVAVIFALFYWLIITMTVLGDQIFAKIKWHISNSMSDVFLKFTLWLIAFCFFNVILLQVHLFYGIVILAQFIALTYLTVKNKKVLAEIAHNAEEFMEYIHHSFTKDKITKVFYIGVLIIAVLYICMWLYLAYIPYPTAWDANHAYIFLPRSWANNGWLYRWSGGITGAIPYLWYWFLTFWFAFADVMPGSGLFGISPDALTIIMNFWSWPLVLLSSWFTLYAFMKFIIWDAAVKSHYKLYWVLLGVFLVLLWLTSWMWAFLVFVDNKTDMAVMFFTMIALYAGLQYLQQLTHNHDGKKVVHYAILSWVFFGASAIAKPTGMFDIIHFAMLLLLQFNWVLLGIGWYLFILWGLWLTKLLLVTQFITTSQAYMLIAVGVVAFIVWLIPTIKQKFRTHYVRSFGMWILTILAVMIIFKWPFALVQQILNNWSINIPQAIRTIFLSNTSEKDESQRILLASNVSPATLAKNEVGTGSTWGTESKVAVVSTVSNEQARMQCLSTEWTKDLYRDLKTAWNDGANEDLGRYVWYWQKAFKNLLLLSWLPKWCYSIYEDARELCSKIAWIDTANKTNVIAILDTAKSSVKNDTRLDEWIAWLQSADQLAETRIKRAIIAYVQSNTILVTDKDIAIPYKFLVPFNVTMNWSLQNLSSYYTDIGIMWLLGLLLAIIWLIYGILVKNKKLLHLSLITLGAWAVWRVVASSIIWYSLWLIIWTIVAILVFVHTILSTKNAKNVLEYNVTYGIVWLLILWWVIQLVMNLYRIASQWAGWPFGWYKSNVGERYVINDQLMAERQIKIGFNANDVLNLQFPHYKGIKSILNTRGDNEWVVIAGTYLQYFIDDQSNVQSDWFLSIFWENISDNNVCNSYLRLKDQKKKYIVIDPNIASVVMSDSNKTLFERFYAVLTPEGNLKQHGTLTMIQALTQQWYLKLLYTNNLITKYAFILSDAQLSQSLWVTDPEKLILERAKMTAARFFPAWDTYWNLTLQIFAARLNTYEGIWDISDILWRPIRYDMVVEVAKFVDKWVQPQEYNILQEKMASLNQDEKVVLQQYFSLKQAQKQNPQQFREFMVWLVQQSINNTSQLIALSVE